LGPLVCRFRTRRCSLLARERACILVARGGASHQARSSSRITIANVPLLMSTELPKSVTLLASGLHALACFLSSQGLRLLGEANVAGLEASLQIGRALGC